MSLLIAGRAWAESEPVRDDIVDIRHGRAPNRRVVLGWTADNRVVVHVAACGVNDGGGPFCGSTLEVSGPRGTSRTEILAPPCKVCGASEPVFEVSTTLASKAIRAEAKALAALGPLRAGEIGATMRVKQSTCRVAVPVPGASFALPDCISDGGSSSIQGARVQDVRRSPDGAWLAITLALDIKWVEWTDPVVVVKVVPVPP